MQMVQEGYQMTLDDLGIWSGKMCREPSQAENQKEQILRESSKKSVVYRRSPYLYLDRRMGHGLLPGLFWDRNSLLLGENSCPRIIPAVRRGRISGRSCRKSSGSQTVPVMCLDLTPGAGNLLGLPFWENDAAWLGECWTLNTGESPSVAVESFLWQILEDSPPQRYYLSQKACRGILERVKARGKKLPEQLLWALKKQAGIEG